MKYILISVFVFVACFAHAQFDNPMQNVGTSYLKIHRSGSNFFLRAGATRTLPFSNGTTFSMRLIEPADVPDLGATYFKQGGNSFAATNVIGPKDNNDFHILRGDTVRVKLSATTLEMENNRTGSQNIILADRTTAPGVGQYSGIGISLNNVITGEMRSYNNSLSNYGLGFTTLAGGFPNSVNGLYITHLNKVGINRDTASYYLDVKGGGTESLIGRFQGNDENVFVYLHNSTTGNASTDGLAISMTNSDATISNRESGTMTFSTNATPAISIDASQNTTFSGRILGKKGPNVASASTITLGSGNFFHITGNTTINEMTETGWTNGSTVVLWFQDALTVTHNATSTGATPFWCAGSVNLTVSANSAYSFVFDGTYWRQVN